MQSESNTSSVTPTAPSKMGKFQASKTIVKESWAVLKQDKEIMWFPVVSTICTLVAVLVMGVIFYFVIFVGVFGGISVGGAKHLNGIATYGMLFVYYLVIFFIINFFEAGLYIVVQSRFSGQNLSFSQGINEAKKYLSKVFFWSLISATVGIILGIISDKLNFVGKIVVSLLGAAWSIMTFFSLPSLVIGNLSIKDSFKESARIIRKTWGETIIVNFGVGLFFGLIIFALLGILTIIAIVFKSIFVTLFLSILFFISVLIISVVSSTLNSIFKLVLFNYARTGQIPQGFSADIVKTAVK